MGSRSRLVTAQGVLYIQPHCHKYMTAVRSVALGLPRAHPDPGRTTMVPSSAIAEMPVTREMLPVLADWFPNAELVTPFTVTAVLKEEAAGMPFPATAWSVEKDVVS